MPTSSRRGFLALNGAALLSGRLLAAAESHTPAPPRLDEWGKVRAQFRLAPQYVHMAGFYIASHPAPVRDAIEGLRRALDENPFLSVEHGMFESEAENLQRKVREDVAAYLGVQQDEIALTSNTTAGLSLVYNGLRLKAGDEIVVTTHDHYVHHESARFAAQRSGASLRRVPLFADAVTATPDEIVAGVRKAIRPATRALGVTWVHSSTGMKLPVAKIAAAVAEANQARAEADRVLLVVDGVHGIGAAEEQVKDLGCDFFCAGTHKWIFAPRGTGIVWGRPSAWARVEPLVPTFTEMESYRAWTEDRPARGPVNARRMTPGGFWAYEHQWAMGAAFRMHQQIGRARVAARVRELNQRCRDRLAAIRGVKLRTPNDPSLRAGITCFEVDGFTVEDVVKRLLERRIVASTSPYAVSYARLSAGIFNTPEEVDRSVAAVAAIATRS